MENNYNQAEETRDSNPPEKVPETAHDLAQKMIEDENFHVSDEQMKNIDTAVVVPSSKQAEADKLADNLEEDGSANSADIIGGL